MTADMLDFGIFGFMKIKDKVGFFNHNGTAY